MRYSTLNLFQLHFNFWKVCSGLCILCYLCFQLLNTMHPSELGTFLRKPEVVDNKTKLCTIFRNYKKTPEFLETVRIADCGHHFQALTEYPFLRIYWKKNLLNGAFSQSFDFDHYLSIGESSGWCEASSPALRLAFGSGHWWQGWGWPLVWQQTE